MPPKKRARYEEWSLYKLIFSSGGSSGDSRSSSGDSNGGDVEIFSHTSEISKFSKWFETTQILQNDTELQEGTYLISFKNKAVTLNFDN